MAKLFDLDAIQAIAADDSPAPHSLSAETRQILLACFGLLHDTYNWHDYDEELTQADEDTIEALVSKAMDEITAMANLNNNSRMYWDGVTVRSAYTYISNNNGAFQIGSTATTIVTSPDMAGSVNVTASRFLIGFTCLGFGTVTGDQFIFYWQYNFNNGGVEGWRTFDSYPPAGAIYFYRKRIASSGHEDTHSFLTNFDAGNTAQTWGFSGTYKIRLAGVRVNGSGTFNIYSSGVGLNNINSFSIIEV